MAVFTPSRFFQGAAPTVLTQAPVRTPPRSVPTAAWTADQNHRPVCGWKVDPPKDR